MVLYYLSTVYSSCPDGLEKAYEDTKEAVVNLTLAGYSVFSPILYNHQLQHLPEFKSFSSYDSKRNWLTEDIPYMKICDSLIIYQMENWTRSIGISYEKGYFEALDRPVLYMPYRIWETSQDWFRYE